MDKIMYQKYSTDGTAKPSSAANFYVAITNERHPLTGEAMPCVKKINESTTIKELIEWYKTFPHGKGILYDLRIIEAT